MKEAKRPELRQHVIEPKTLLAQVVNTAPFLFERAQIDQAIAAVAEPGEPPKNLIPGYISIAHPIDAIEKQKTKVQGQSSKLAERLRALKEQNEELPVDRYAYVKSLREFIASPPDVSDLWTYYDLSLCAHFATVGTFVPTDVDMAIRQKLWSGIRSESALMPLWERIKQMHAWDESLVSKRLVITKSGKKLSGHQGEWFTVAMAAYGCALKVAKTEIGGIREVIEDEFKNQEEALTELFADFEENPGLQSMKDLLSGIAAVAHNLGDLDRMFEPWEISDHDVLRRRVFRAGHEDARHPKPVFLKAGLIYQEMLASENHRHFALREPKCLRRDEKYLLPFGPFFDDWGKQLLSLREGEQREVAEALILGWKKLNPLSIYTSQGYARALVGMCMGYGEQVSAGQTVSVKYKAGREVLLASLSPALQKDLNESGLRTLMSVSQGEYEKKWFSRLRTELARLAQA